MLDKSKVNVVSFNVNGIRSTEKRRSIFNYLKNHKSHIILLQETHSLQEDEIIWSNEWGSKITYAHGSNFSKGVAILFQKGFPAKIESTLIDVNGRYIILEVLIEGVRFLLVNVYGPNEDNPDFYLKLFETVETREISSMIMVGDFNTTLDVTLDLYNNAGINHVNKREVLQEYISLKGLMDVWRIMHPEEKVYTWKKPNSRELSMSRLDFFLVSPDIFLRTNRAEIKTRYLSDHSRISLEIDFSEVKRGPSYWKFNNLHLQSKEFVEMMNNTILKYLYEVKPLEESEPTTQWENLKTLIKNKAQTFSLEKAKEKNMLIEKLENRILEFDKRLIVETDQNKRERYLKNIRETEQFLLDQHEERVKAACFRSKAEYYLYGEKNSKYFFNLERTRGNAKIISKIVREDGSIIKNPKEILKEERLFYERLYGHNDTKPFQFNNNTNRKLSDLDKAQYEEDFSDLEFSNSLMGMANNKTPGLDGLSADFYKVFWIHLKVLYGQTLRYVLNRGLLHRSARLGLITLLPKKEKDLNYLNNWRPLTMLNVDFKILSRAIALRLKKNIKELVHEDQTGFIEGRNINQSLRTIIDVMQVAKQKSIDLIIVSLDWEKCFDRITFPAIKKALVYFNFGPKFIATIETLLSDSYSCVTNNGYLSSFFRNLSGVKQGSNASPLIYNLVAEILSNYIRENAKIKGIVIGDMEHKIAQFADDLNLFLKFERECLLELENVLEEFEGATGFRVNYDKTCLYRVGSLTNSDAKFITRKPFVWTNGPIKILGINLHNDEEMMMRLNLEPLLDKTHQITKLWSYRGLTLAGKVLTINSLCISLYIYRLSVLGKMGKQYVDSFIQIIKKFLWNGGRPKLALSKLYNVKEYGGLGLVDIQGKDISLKTQWVAVIKDSPKIQNLAEHFLPKIAQDLWVCNFHSKDVNSFMGSSFWRDVVKAWADTYYFNPDNPTKIAAQSLWYNSSIKIKKKCVFYNRAYQAGILFVYNIWNKITNSFMTFPQIQEIYGQDIMSWLQYCALTSAIPKNWVRVLKSTRNILESFHFPFESFEGKMSALVYNKIISHKDCLQKLCQVWSIKMSLQLEYNLFLSNFQRIYILTTSTKIRNFQFRFMHRIIYCSNTLYKWKLTDSPLCTFCNLEYETIEHLFYHCNKTQRFLEMFQAWFECLTDTEIQLDMETVFFCNHQDELLNVLLIILKQYIFNRRCLDKELNVYTFKDYIYSIIRIERYSAFKTKRFKPFVKRWERMFCT